MSYGFNFDEVKNIQHPEKTQIKWGYYIDAIREPKFSLKQFFLKKAHLGALDLEKGVLFMERGELVLNLDRENILLRQRDVLIIPNSSCYNFSINEDSLTYFFSTEGDSSNKILNIRQTFDKRDKYWGRIETIVSNDFFTGKKIFMNKNTQSSLEYHCKKREAYFLQSGKLKIGLRVGRAENKSVTLNPEDVFIINPGLMHMRIALEDSVIMEVSTKDDDKDSHLVENGETYVHVENIG